MGISGLWASRTASDYTGATRLGTGIDPIHAVRDRGRGRVVGTRENLYPLGEPSGEVPAELTGDDVDWLCEDHGQAPIPGESFRYQEEHPRWNETTPAFRGATNSPAMGEQSPWGVYFDDDATGMWPQPGPTGGMQRWLATDHGETVEQQHAIAVPTRSVTGGWLAKVRGAPAAAESQEPGQDGFVWTINNAAVQGPGLRELGNDRAVARGTDAPRSGILSRVAGASQKMYALSLRMGGGPGTPDMFPFQQSPGLKRPFFGRTAATPPPEIHMMGTMEGRVPFQRYVPADPYQGDPETGSGEIVAPSDWGY